MKVVSRSFLAVLVSQTALLTHSAFAQLPAISRQDVANMGPGCNVRMMVPTSAEFPLSYAVENGQGGGSVIIRNLPKSFSQGTLFLGMVCYHDNDEQTTFSVIRFDSGSKKWVKDASAWKKEANNSTDPEHREHLKQLIKTTLVYDIQAKNSQGWALTQEDLIGDENNRTRHLTYCLIHPPKALCGEGEVGYLKDGPKGDLTGYALKILRSIEFLDDEPPMPENAPAPAAKPAPPSQRSE